MNFYIQDPTFSGTYSTHEALLKACETALYGGGAYAFVSADGAKLFLEDDTFKHLIARGGSFTILIGMDEITNEKAIQKLTELRQTYAGHLVIYAFMQETKNSLYHPKFSWFRTEVGGELVIGSGNLTEKGLRRNREAFGTETVDDAKIIEVERYWSEWITHNAQYLKEIDDPAVIVRARENKRKFIRMNRFAEATGPVDDITLEDHDELVTPEMLDIEDKETWLFTDDSSVFITEINKNGTRTTQVNLNRHDFQYFFGGDPTRDNRTIRVLFRQVLAGGIVDVLEIRPGVPVQSENFRFELKAMGQHHYPGDLSTRPIGVFIKVSVRDFLYTIVWPMDDCYNDVKEFLYRYTPVIRVDRMKNYSTTVADLRNAVPQLPFWDIT